MARSDLRGEFSAQNHVLVDGRLGAGEEERQVAHFLARQLGGACHQHARLNVHIVVEHPAQHFDEISVESSAASRQRATTSLEAMAAENDAGLRHDASFSHHWSDEKKRKKVKIS